MKKIYLEAFTTTNFGDDLFVKIICERYPQHRFYINCSRFDDQAFESIENLTIMNRTHFKGMIINNLKRLLNKLHIDIRFPYDAQVYIGGSIFPEPTDFLENDWYKMNYYHKKQSTKLPYYVIGANFGPYVHEEFKNFMDQYFKDYVDGICFRDQASYALFSKYPHITVAPDLVFQLNTKKSIQKNLVLITVIYYDGRSEIESFSNEDYIQKMAELTKYYQSLHKEVVFISFNEVQKDSIIIDEINQKLERKAIKKVYTGNLKEMIELFEQCEYVIGTRFHSIVMSMNVEVPVYPICYSNKTQNLLDDLHFQGNYSHIQEFCGKCNEEIDANRINQYLVDCKAYRKLSQNQFQQIDQLLGGPND